jgi:hypothetical protein
MNKYIGIITLLLFLAIPSTIHAASSVELLKDTQFTNGFGACFWLGANYIPGPDVMKYGLCHAYIATPGHTVKVIPDDNPAKTVAQNNENKYWEINDGVHETDSNHVPIPDPFIHRFNVNYHVIDNQPAILNVEQLNQNGQRVKQIATNKQGKIYLYYNSKNEIRNVANKYGSEFAYDTWPTFQINQNFREYIDLAGYTQIQVSLQPRILSWTILPGWPSVGVPGTSPPEMALNLYTFIRDRNAVNTGMFVGMALYSDNAAQYSPYNSLDQYGQGFFRDNVSLYGGPAIPNTYKTIQFDLLSLVDKALIQANVRKPDGNYKTHADYLLSSFDIGYEGMGWFEGSVDIQNLSMIGTATGTAGDVTNDNHVNNDDLDVIKAKFGNPYTIFDYNNLVENFGK